MASKADSDEWLIVASSIKQTVHVFKTEIKKKEESKVMATSWFSLSSITPSYLANEGAFCKFRIEKDSQKPKLVVVKSDASLCVIDDCMS